MKRLRNPRTILFLGLALWLLYLLIGLAYSFQGGFIQENFGMALIALTALCPDIHHVAEYNQPLLYGWAIATGLILSVWAVLAWRKQSLPLALFFTIGSVALSILGIIRMIMSLATIH